MRHELMTERWAKAVLAPVYGYTISDKQRAALQHKGKLIQMC